MYSKRTWWPVFSVFSLSAFALVAISLSGADAQNLPPPGAYQPIPNFTGVGAGLQFREAINDRMSGVQPISPTLAGPSFANLPAEQDGMMLYCKDCKRSTPCANGGEGAWAVGTRSQWSCTIGTLESSLNANGNKIASLANGTATGDALAFGQASAQLNTLAGAKGDGSDALTGFNVNGTFNVKAYGAKCDGSTDDVVAIQTAINAADNAETAAGATPVMFPPTPTASCKISRPLVNASPSNQLTPALFGAGAAATTISPTFTGPAIVLVGQGPAAQIKTSLTGNIISGGSGSSMTWASNSTDYFDLSEVLPTVTSVQPYVGPFNGKTQWDIRAFIKPADFSQTRCVWASSGAFYSALYTSGDLGAGGMGYLCTEADGQLHGMLDISGTTVKVASGSTLTAGAVYEVELNFDGTHVNLYLGTGGVVTRVAQTTPGGTAITQRADENDILGTAQTVWPYNTTANTFFWQGAMQSVQMSNIARNTAASYTEDTANFASDGNTLFLDNFDLNQFTGGVAVNPTVQVDAPSNAWMALHIGELGCCGGNYNVGGLNIFGSESVGVYADAATLDVSHITTNAKMYGIETSRTGGFGSFIHDMTEAAGVANNAVAGILSLGGITPIRDVLAGADMFSIYTTGYSVENIYLPGNTRNICGIGVENYGGGVNAAPIHLSHIAADTESGGTFPSVCIAGGNGPVSITDSFLQPSNASSVQLIGTAGPVTVQGTDFSQLTGSLVDTTYVTNGNTAGASVIFDNDSYAGSYTLPSGVTYTNFGFPYSAIDHTPRFHHLQIPVVPAPEPGANGTTFCGGGVTTCAYPVPVDVHVGDVEIAAPAIRGGSPGTVTPPAGWTLACTSDNSANNTYVAVYWHVVTPNDAATYTWTIANSGLVWSGGIASFSGVNQLNPVDVCQASSSAAGTSSNSLTGMTTSDQNDIDVFLATMAAPPLSLPSPPTNTALVYSNPSGSAETIWSYLPGSTTVPAVTVNSGGTAVGSAGVQLALRPGLSQTSAMKIGEGSPPLYQGEPGATLQSLATNVQIEAPNIIGTVTTSTTISFATQSVQDITTATTGLTYTLSTVGVTPNQDVMIRSHIAGTITGPLWATSSGAIRWAGGTTPTSSGTNGYTDIIRLYFDGTNWQEISRSIGNR